MARPSPDHHVREFLTPRYSDCPGLTSSPLFAFAYSEPEAGAIHASTLATLHHLRPSQSFLLCDAGGGTVDTAVYKLMGQLSELEIAEMCVRSGANTGSLFVDLKFEELLRRM